MSKVIKHTKRYRVEGRNIFGDGGWSYYNSRKRAIRVARRRERWTGRSFLVVDTEADE